MIQEFFVWLLGPELSIILLAILAVYLILRMWWGILQRALREEYATNKHTWRG